MGGMGQAVETTLGETSMRGNRDLLIRCLGDFTVEIDRRSVLSCSADYGKAGNRVVTAIFAYLVANIDRPIGRKGLMDLFWPDSEGDKAGNSLSRSLSGLRELLRTQVDGKIELVVRRNGDEAYGLRPKVPYRVDENLFVQKVKAGDRLKRAGDLNRARQELESARDLYRGAYMKAVAHNSWCLPRRSQLQELYHIALFELSDIFERAGEPIEALDHLFKVLDSDTANESAYLKLIDLHWRRGDRTEALRIYHLYCQVLWETFGLQPLPSVEALSKRILSGEKPADCHENVCFADVLSLAT